MNKTEETDPRLKKAEHRLALLIQHEVDGRGYSEHTLERVQCLVKEFSMSCRLKGIDMPKLVVVGLPKLRHLVIWPADATFLDLQIRIKELIMSLRRVGREVDHEELAIAIKHAYPDYGPMMNAHLESLEEKQRLPIYGPN